FGCVQRPTARGGRAVVARRVEDARRAARTASPSAATFRRRRMVTMIVLVAATAFIVGLVLYGPLGRPGDGPLTITGPTGDVPIQPAATHVHVVQPGETLWSI